MTRYEIGYVITYSLLVEADSEEEASAWAKQVADNLLKATADVQGVLARTGHIINPADVEKLEGALKRLIDT